MKPDPRQLVDGLVAGDRAALARAITLAESALPRHQELAEEVLELCLSHASPREGGAVRLGVSGVPGVGKSTFVDALGVHLVREREETVAVLAVDPTSPVHGGSILGDKTRMPRLASDPRAFIRPSPSGGSLGGVARATRLAIVLCEAAGYRNILVETVGVGQSEVAVADMTDCFLLLMLPGAGDELQGMKRGIMELVDLVIINKADGGSEGRAARARSEYEAALHLFPPPPHGWAPVVGVCSAQENRGVREAWELVLRHRAHMQESGWLHRRRAAQARRWLVELIEGHLREAFLRSAAVRERMPGLEGLVEAGALSPLRAARQLLEAWEAGGKG
ncbi:MULTISPECIES: methylmalonyl Co-A mutase-associated GTPase MeaB [Sorangium]|uniref:Protein kinase n=1 Tax=Sorangium cellulosum TaxID=56 RepID=A0A4P2QMS8_SORCE|nr:MULTISPECIES: methylmalonyl Co-A mutase-associated GTPase MeaB [Sorangium]AUX31397.1 protein kinase [Sorangium cellulosum]WCQ90780.1 putative GTPase [Sorangium sp. Soce836]